MKKVSLLVKILSLFTLLLTTSCDEINDILGIENDVNIESGLMAYYTFDDGTADDITENGLDATLINGPSFTAETVNGSGKAIFFNSQKGQYMNIPYNPFSEIESYSISMWVKDFGYGSFIKADRYFDFFYDEYGQFCIGRYHDYPFIYDAKTLIDGTWHMITVVTSIDNQKLYVDGSLVASEDTSVRKMEGAKLIVNNHMKLDNLRLYNRDISAKEVKAIYDLEK